MYLIIETYHPVLVTLFLFPDMEETVRRNTDKLNVVVIDDDADMVSTLCDLLEIGGVNVIGIGYNGKEAVELYKKLRPDVVFLDIMMPDYDGFYALENIRLVNNHAKILMVTADLRRETAERLRGIPSLEVVYKSFDLNDLLKGLDRLLKNSVDTMAYEGATFTMIPEVQIKLTQPRDELF